jgi:outer membrane protein OmpA-like peptidoglycan-associated protein
MLKRVQTAAVVLGAVAMLATAATASAQSTGSPQTPAKPTQPAPTQSTAGGDETRPATTTFRGDTGLWFVPTGEVLPAKRWSLSAYRVNFDFSQGFTDVSDWPVTFGVGLGDRAEIFGAWTLVRRIDRDVRPIFISDQTEPGGLVNDYPFMRSGWSDNRLGDFWVGGKVNLLSEYRQNPVALAVRGMLKLPFAPDDEEGVGTGKVDIELDAIVSKEVNQRVELSGYGGFMFRSDPDDADLSNGFRWGFGAGFPTRKALRVTAELHGESYFDDTVTYTGTRLIGEDDLTVPPPISRNDSPVYAHIGVTWIGSNGIFAGAGVGWNLALNPRDDFTGFDSETGDALGFQFRVGYHPGVRVYVPPPPPPPPAPPPPAPPQNRPPTAVARCEPCTVEIGRTATVTCDASDPDGDRLTYKWSAPAGKLTNPADRQTTWTAPMQEGPVQFSCQVDDGKGGTASANVTIQVIRPAVKEFVFEDVDFDFDRYSLRPEATRALDEAVNTLKQNADLRIQVEGHTCNIGTPEYNLALGERRAQAVRDYLASRGIGADRMTTVSYGEERPKHDNAREETRRLNRRAAMVVRIQR